MVLLYKKDDLRTRISDFRTAKLRVQLTGLYFKNLKSLVAIRKSNHNTGVCNVFYKPLMPVLKREFMCSKTVFSIAGNMFAAKIQKD